MLPPFFHQTPFFRLLLPFIAGIVAGTFLMIPTGYCLPACILSMIATVLFLLNWNRLFSRNLVWLYGIFLNLFFFAVGICSVSLRTFVPEEESEHGIWLIVIDEPPVERTNSIKATAQIRANIENEQTDACDELVITYFRKDSLSRNIRQGDLLLIDATLNPVKNAGNPYEFDYRGYLARKHIGRSAFVESGQWRQLDSYAQSPLFNFSNRLRNNLLDVFKRAGLTGNELAVASALTLGYKADIDDELRNAYSSSGAMHVLAVSGLHVGIIYMVLNTILNLFPFVQRKKWLRALMLLTSLWLYALITGLSPSVLRAATMFSFIAAGNALNRRTYIYNSIAASAFVLMLANPDILFEVGFQLSYMAVIFIVFIHPYLYGLLSFKNRLLDYAWSLTCVSVAAQAGTAPLSLFYFQQFPSYFLLSNFVVIPAASIIIYGAILLFAVSSVPLLLQIFGQLLNGFIYTVNFLIFFLEKMPGSVVAGIRFAGWEMVFAYILFAALSVWLFTKRKAVLFAMLVLPVFWTAFATIRTGADLRRQQLIVYNTSRSSLVQFINGRDNTVFYAARNPEFNISSFLENQRTAMQLADERYHHLDSALYAKNNSYMPENLFASGNFVQFAGKRLAIFTRDMPPQDADGSFIKTDVVILSQNVNVRIPQIVESYRPDVIVIDASNTVARIDRWENECVEAGVKCHRVDRDGAFVTGN